MTLSKFKKKKLKILESLNQGKQKLSNDRGKFEQSQNTKPNKKARRHSGRVTPQIIKPKTKYDDIKKDALEPQVFYDDWMDRRDGFRDDGDRTKLRKEKQKSWYFTREEIKEINKRILNKIKRKKDNGII